MKKNVLWVEDDPNDVFLIQRAWKQAGEIPVSFHFRIIDNGEEAIDYLSGAHRYARRDLYPLPAFVLLDLKLPRASGFEILSWIRNREALQHLPVVILTSSQESRDIRKAYELGANSYIVKPGEPSRLIEMALRLKQYWLDWNELPVGAS